MALSHSEAGKLGRIASDHTQKQKYAARILAYNAKPTLCKFCKKQISYAKRTNVFCDQSCAASYNNQSAIAQKRPKKNFGNCLICQTSTVGGPYCSTKCVSIARVKDTIAKIEAGEKVSVKTMKSYLISVFGNTCLSPDCAWDHARRPVCVEIEHKDGNSTNNDLSNLTLLCPNCHSLTPTYKGKNKGNGRAYRRQRYADGKSY